MSIENTQAMPINDVLPHAFNVCVSTKRHPTLIGPSGCGKSQILSEDLRAMLAEHEGMEVGKEEGQFKLWHVDAATTDGAELRGLPDINRDTGRTTWRTPDSLPQEGERGLIMIDEPNTAMDKSFLFAMYQLLGNEARIGEWELPDGVYIALAGNRMEDAVGLEELPAPFRARCWIQEVRPEVNAVVNYAIEKGWDIRVIAATRAYPEMITDWDAESDDQSPNARAMEDCSDALTGWEKMGGLQSGLAAQFSGFIGRDAAIKVATIVKQFTDLIPVSLIVESPSTAPMPQSIDMELSLVCALAKCADQDNLEPIVEYVGRLRGEGRSQESAALFRNVLISEASKEGNTARNSHAFDEFVRR